ncbi:hypothetical protein DEFR109230_01355 [Deinococcus frigens]
MKSAAAAWTLVVLVSLSVDFVVSMVLLYGPRSVFAHSVLILGATLLLVAGHFHGFRRSGQKQVQEETYEHDGQ